MVSLGDDSKLFSTVFSSFVVTPEYFIGYKVSHKIKPRKCGITYRILLKENEQKK